MSNDDCQLSDGVTFEALPENEFTRQIPSFSRGFVRLHPYNQVRKGSFSNNVWQPVDFLVNITLTQPIGALVCLSVNFSSLSANVICECSLMNGSNSSRLMESRPKFQVFPKCFLSYQKRLKEFECRDDDVWVASFPKCGEQSRDKENNYRVIRHHETMVD